MVAAGGTLTLATASGTHHLTVEDGDILDGDVVLEDDLEDDLEDEQEEILETEEVLDEDECLENPPD